MKLSSIEAEVTPVYLASGNAHKVGEFRELAAESSLSLQILPATAIGGMPPVVEDTGSFIGN
ncbi:MAG TPA: hypothetical protein VHF69_13810, partial [Candidatus Synoicihabitans sp.]|nr:hypothetical protein [Candidatus Synoicihabitans sp.]